MTLSGRAIQILAAVSGKAWLLIVIVDSSEGGTTVPSLFRFFILFDGLVSEKLSHVR